MHDAIRIYLYVFGAITMAGGVVGYVKAKSGASILAGSVFGGLLLVAGYLVGHGGKLGLGLGLWVSAMLAGRFAKAFRSNGKVMPGGLMALLGLVGIGLCVIGFAS
jgi:uncharacterized membrane protein (UPF0136 family)